jgi:integrase
MRSAKGSVYKLGKDHYRVQVEGARNPKTGKRQRITRVVRGSRRKAEEVKAALLVEAGSPDTARESMTLQAFWESLYADSIRGLREKTKYEYASKWSAYIEEPLGGMPLRSIRPATVQTWLQTIDGDSRRVEAMSLLSRVLSKAAKFDLLGSNPCDHVNRPKRPRYKPEVLTAEQARAYLRNAAGSDVEAAVLIALGGGLRRSEIVAIDWRDIDPDGTVTVDDAVTSVGGRAVDDRPKTENSTRLVHLPAGVARRLNELRSADADPVLADSNGNRMNPDNVSKHYRKWLGTLPDGLPRITLKNLRHTSLTLTLESGVDLLAVSRRAGHSNVGITASYYLRPHESVDIGAAESLDSLL